MPGVVVDISVLVISVVVNSVVIRVVGVVDSVGKGSVVVALVLI